MPVKFVVQLKRKAIVFEAPFEGVKDLWADTEWSDLATARQKYPQHEYREVMVQW